VKERLSEKASPTQEAGLHHLHWRSQNLAIVKGRLVPVPELASKRAPLR
jgi:hypothetical protein